MKKILISYSVIISLLALIVFPILLLMHSNHMQDHRGMTGCIVHCLESVEGFTQPYNTSIISTLVITVAQLIYSKIYEFTLSLSLLYVFILFPPPNILRYIKNYSYSQLR